MSGCCIVVMGHVDHGKTALVRALTGIETDRLPEEKARGLSIAPGFAYLETDAGTIDLVDAPGHEDFIHAMIAGASGASAALIVISAVDGIAAQTVEHLEIASLLGISRAVVAVTQADLVEAADQPARIADISASLAKTPFHSAPMIACSALKGDGVAALAQALVELADASHSDTSPQRSFLSIDRVFSRPGHGTIVTGTLLGHGLAQDDVLMLQPANRPVTIRGLQSRGTARTNANAGERTAINLRGIAADDVSRGDVLASQGTAAASECMDVLISVLPQQNLKHMQDVRVHFGTTSVVAQVRLLKGGQEQFGQLRFRKPVCGYAGQRAILRRLSPATTLGGAIFLDPNAHPFRGQDANRFRVLNACAHGDALQIATALTQEGRGMAKQSDVARLSRRNWQDVEKTLNAKFEFFGDGLIGVHSELQEIRSAVLEGLSTYHLENPLHLSAPRTAVMPQDVAPEVLHHVETSIGIAHHGNGVALAGHDPFDAMTPDQHKRMSALEATFEQSGLAPQHAKDTSTDQDMIALLEHRHRLVRLKNVSLNQSLLFHMTALQNAAAALRRAFPAQQAFTTGEARETLGTSRKVIVPVLEYFDRTQVTQRDGNTRHMLP